jgi:hypothetical protein
MGVGRGKGMKEGHGKLAPERGKNKTLVWETKFLKEKFPCKNAIFVDNKVC